MLTVKNVLLGTEPTYTCFSFRFLVISVGKCAEQWARRARYTATSPSLSVDRELAGPVASRLYVDPNSPLDHIIPATFISGMLVVSSFDCGLTLGCRYK